MRSLVHHSGVAAVVPVVNVDTDQIIPARFLHRSRARGFGDVLFCDLRFREDGSTNNEFVLNRSPHDKATILIALDNFGCGSSREHAVWALMDFGIRVVIAPSFGDIFFGNAFKNGLLPVVLTPAETEKLIALAVRPHVIRIKIDLPAQRIMAGRLVIKFSIDPYYKEVLLQGLSETKATLSEIASIEEFENRHSREAPWLGVGPLETSSSK